MIVVGIQKNRGDFTMKPSFRLDRSCPCLVEYIRLKVTELDSDERNKQELEQIENIDKMYIEVQKLYKAEDIEVSAAFRGSFTPIIKYDIGSIRIGEKVENGDHYTNIKPVVEKLIAENKGSRNFSVAVWHNHQFSTNFSIADIIPLLEYGCTYETFLDSERIIVLTMSEQAKEFFRHRKVSDVVKLMNDFREPIAKEQRSVFLETIARKRSGKIDVSEKELLMDKLSEKVLNTVINELVKSGAVGIRMTSFDKIRFKEGA